VPLPDAIALPLEKIRCSNIGYKAIGKAACKKKENRKSACKRLP